MYENTCEFKKKAEDEDKIKCSFNLQSLLNEDELAHKKKKVENRQRYIFNAVFDLLSDREKEEENIKKYLVYINKKIK